MDLHRLSADLSFDHVEKIYQFYDATDLYSFRKCQDVLQRHNWDVGFAFDDHMNLKEGRPTVFALTSEKSSAPTVVIDPTLLLIINSESSGTGNFLSSATDYMLKTFYNVLGSVGRFTLSLVWPKPQPLITGPVTDVERFIQNFESIYGRKHPCFYAGSYKQALIDAKQELRFLVIYLHQNEQSGCSNFCSSVLQDEDVISFLNEDHTIFWACEQGSNEGNRVAVELKANNYPYVAVIVLKQDSMTVVGQIDKLVSPEEFILRIESVFDDNEDHLEMVLEERIEQGLRSIREQQDRVYLESLGAYPHDLEAVLAYEREEQLKQEKKKQERELRLAKEVENLEKAKIEELKKMKTEMLARIPQEPAIEEPGAISIVFIMPGGIRIERRFAHISPLSDVFDFVFCHSNSPDICEVATNFPKRVLNNEDKDKTLEQAGLQNREVLFINNLDN